MNLKITFLIIIFIASAIIFSYLQLPVNRIGITSELIMLGIYYVVSINPDLISNLAGNNHKAPLNAVN